MITADWYRFFFPTKIAYRFLMFFSLNEILQFSVFVRLQCEFILPDQWRFIVNFFLLSAQSHKHKTDHRAAQWSTHFSPSRAHLKSSPPPDETSALWKTFLVCFQAHINEFLFETDFSRHPSVLFILPPSLLGVELMAESHTEGCVQWPRSH